MTIKSCGGREVSGVTKRVPELTEVDLECQIILCVGSFVTWRPLYLTLSRRNPWHLRVFSSTSLCLSVPTEDLRSRRLYSGLPTPVGVLLRDPSPLVRTLDSLALRRQCHRNGPRNQGSGGIGSQGWIRWGHDRSDPFRRRWRLVTTSLNGRDQGCVWVWD